MTFTHALSTNNYGPAKFIVSSSPANGTHTTIASAITAATSGDTIFIRDGTYTENLTLKAGVNLYGFGQSVIIIGNLNYSSAGVVSIQGITLQTNSSFILSVTGSSSSIVRIFNCFFNITNNTGIQFTSSNSSSRIFVTNCLGNILTTGITLYSSSSSGVLFFLYSQINNDGNSATPSNNSAGGVTMTDTAMALPISTSGTGQLLAQRCNFLTSPTNSISFTINGTVLSSLVQIDTSSGAAPCVAIGGGSACTVQECVLSSSNTFVLTGAGILRYSFITFGGSSAGHNVATEIAFPVLV